MMRKDSLYWFTADFHLSHKNIIKYCNRPFDNVEQMDNEIISNLEKMVQTGDVLYYLGDLTFKETVAEEFFDKFSHLEIHYIIGNHDNTEVLKIANKYSKNVSPLIDITIEGISITLCHYAMRVWNNSHLNSWQLYGHSHGTLVPKGKQYDVGVDNNSFKPVSFENLKRIMTELSDNINFIPSESRQTNSNI